MVIIKYLNDNTESHYNYAKITIDNISKSLNFDLNMINDKVNSTTNIENRTIIDAFQLYFLSQSEIVSRDFENKILICFPIDYNIYEKDESKSASLIQNGDDYYIEFNIKFERNVLKSTCEEFINCIITSSLMNSNECKLFIFSYIDQIYLRKYVSDSNGVVFIRNGCLLPMDLNSETIVPFKSPSTFEVTFHLPFLQEITGMLIPKGVTLITGSGFHGKSTLLNAISSGIFFKLPGDRHEFIVTDSTAINIKTEDGRIVRSVDISAFISNLPSNSGLNPADFSSNKASGSTSMASSVIEGISSGSKLFLLDEDSCASNFMILCSRMRALLSKTSIIPFIYRVNSLFHEFDISTIIVIGGSGDWFDVHNTALMMDNYNCIDVTERAKGISKTFCTGRVEYNGRGLVHRLKWPGIINQRKLFLKSIRFCNNICDINNIGSKVKYYNETLFYNENTIAVTQFISSKNSKYYLGLGNSIAFIYLYFLNLNGNDDIWIPVYDLINCYSTIKSQLVSIPTEYEQFHWPRILDVLATINRLKQSLFQQLS